MVKINLMKHLRDHSYGFTVAYIIDTFGADTMVAINEFFLDVPESNWKQVLSDGRVVIFIGAMSSFCNSALNVDSTQP
jgi:hypothetical protein